MKRQPGQPRNICPSCGEQFNPDYGKCHCVFRPAVSTFPGEQPANIPGQLSLEDAADLGPCQWFALCGRPADHLEPHPILGPTPACQRCIDRCN